MRQIVSSLIEKRQYSPIALNMDIENKIHIGLLYGGKSCEHEVSITSARCICEALDSEKYEITMIGIAKSGEWLLANESSPALTTKEVNPVGKTGVSLDYTTTGQIVLRDSVENVSPSLSEIDVIFPVLHGPFGEDGTVQGLMEIAGIAYVGSGVTGSAVGMDKAVAKAVFASTNIPQTDYRVYRKSRWESSRTTVVDEIETNLNYPMFVKPANLGSSVGISKVKTRDELKWAMDHAAEFDVKLIVEQGLENCHEVEVSILGNDDPQASVVGEIVPGGEFYDYEDKYINGVSTSIIPAELPEEVTCKIQAYAIEAFLAIDAAGLARVDFFVDRGSFDIYISEINTMPGFTPISMYPKLWEASGIGYAELLDRLIELALERRSKLDQVKFFL